LTRLSCCPYYVISCIWCKSCWYHLWGNGYFESQFISLQYYPLVRNFLWLFKDLFDFNHRRFFVLRLGSLGHSSVTHSIVIQVLTECWQDIVIFFFVFVVCVCVAYLPLFGKSSNLHLLCNISCWLLYYPKMFILAYVWLIVIRSSILLYLFCIICLRWFSKPRTFQSCWSLSWIGTVIRWGSNQQAVCFKESSAWGTC